MTVVELEADAARRELEEVLKSTGFARNERLSHFLRFLIERHLEGRDRELKESVIGVEVFGRKPDYNPKDDPIVRTEARRLRTRLEKYYDSSGAVDAVIIELPKGGYVPLVRRTAQVSEVKAPLRLRLRRWRLSALAFVGLGIALAAVGLTRLGSRDRLRNKTNTEAYDLYLRARALELLPYAGGIESSLDLFHQAIAKDPSFGPAYAGVAAGYVARSGFDGFSATERADMIAQGWAAAEKALKFGSSVGRWA